MKDLLLENICSVLEGLFLTGLALTVGVLGCVPLGCVWAWTEIRDSWWAYFNVENK